MRSLFLLSLFSLAISVHFTMIGVSAQCSTYHLNQTMTGIKMATLTIIAPAGAKFTFVHTNGDLFSVDIDGGEKFSGEISAGNAVGEITPVTLSITNYDATSSTGGGSSTGDSSTGTSSTGTGTGSGSGKNTASRTTATILTTATATATSMLMMRSSHKQYTPLVIGAGMAAAMLPNFDTVDAATCTAPSVTITLPIKDNNREIYLDLSKANVETAVCPNGYVFHPVNGCSVFRAVYKRVYTNGTGCADVAPVDLTVTSAQGNFVTLSDSMMVPFTGTEFYGRSQTKFSTALSNGQQAAVTAWTGSEYGLGFVAVDFTTSTLTCKAAYNCISGSCTDQNKAGTARCASYSFTSNSTYCFTRNETSPTPFPKISCPALTCDTWCPKNVTESGGECSFSACPNPAQQCTSCFCYPLTNSSEMITPSQSFITIIIIATLAVTRAMEMGMGMGKDTQAV